MTDVQCCNGGCRRRTPIRVLASDLHNRVYAVTRWKDRGEGLIEAIEKHDVTRDVEALLARAREQARVQALAEAGRLVRDHLFGHVDAEQVADFLDSRAARVAPDGQPLTEDHPEEDPMNGQAAQPVVMVNLTAEEIDVLAVALARSVYPDSRATNAYEASADVWTHSPGGPAGSLATLLAEARAALGVPHG